ncbi:hypothetical protein IID23_00225 [Patescibacteria group bacterium]|nr:hypothetical protein [Patescibacteria group bacterium]
MSRNLITVLTLTLITLLSVVIVVLAQTFLKSTLPEATKKQIEPLDPTLNLELIEELESSVK